MTVSLDANAPSAPKDLDGKGKTPHVNVPWYTTELETMWRHPDMTAAELHNLIPRHTPAAIRNKRAIAGRYNRHAIPMCQRCGQHTVAVKDPWAKARWLCAECALEEKEWYDLNEERLRRENDARRKRKQARKNLMP